MDDHTSQKPSQTTRSAAGRAEAPRARRQRASRSAGAGRADLWLGRQLRSLRRAKQLSLKQVAEEAGLSIGMVSQVERGLASPSIRSLRQIGEALGVPVSWFFHQAGERPADEADKIVRREDRRQLHLPTMGTNADLVTMELLTPDLAGALQLMLMTLAPHFVSGPVHQHAGEEAGLVLSGAFRLWLGDESFVVNEGDSFRFTSERPHRYANASEGVTRVMWVLTPPVC